MDEAYEQNREPLRRPVMYYGYDEERTERISKMVGWAFITLAVSIDVSEMILEWLAIGIFGLSTLLSLCATFTFWIWFKNYGVQFTGKPKNLLNFGSTAILEAVPGLDAIFGIIWTIGIFALVASTMEEDGQRNLIVTIYQNTLKKIGL